MHGSPALKLAGRRALVTGASRGIGLAIARALARQGADVAITGRTLEPLQKAARTIAVDEARVLPIPCHQGRPEAIEGLFQELDETWEAVDLLIVNAATNPVMGPLVEMERPAWDKVMEVNLTGAFLTAQEAARRMIRQKSGRIIFVSSVAGIDPLEGIGAYSISKAALIGMTRVLAKELAPYNVLVNALAPGIVQTRLSSALFENEEVHASIMSRIPMGRHGEPEDVVAAALYLCSEQSGYVTGQVLQIDGGAHM